MTDRDSGPPGPHPLDSLLRRYALEAERLGRAFCRRHDLHPTDFQALGMVMEAEQAGAPLTPHALAAALDLSSGATSAAIDRLEKTGHVKRSRESSDRRLVHLHYTPAAMQVGREFFAPLGQRTAQVRSRYSPEQLQTVAEFLSEMIDALRSHQDTLDESDAASDLN